MAARKSDLDHGRPKNLSALSEGMQELWNRAAQIQKETKPKVGEWVPVRSLRLREDIMPRESMDSDAIARYAEHFHELPPILVQKDTFVVIDGKHRIFAARAAVSDFILIEERDVPDNQLMVEMMRANRDHGVPMSRKERADYARKMMAAKPKITDKDIAEATGFSTRTLERFRAEDDERAARRETSRQAKNPTLSGSSREANDAQVAFDEPDELTVATVEPQPVAAGVVIPAVTVSTTSPNGNGASAPAQAQDDGVLRSIEALVILLHEHWDVEPYVMDLPADVLERYAEAAGSASGWLSLCTTACRARLEQMAGVV